MPQAPPALALVVAVGAADGAGAGVERGDDGQGVLAPASLTLEEAQEKSDLVNKRVRDIQKKLAKKKEQYKDAKKELRKVEEEYEAALEEQGKANEQVQKAFDETRRKRRRNGQ